MSRAAPITAKELFALKTPPPFLLVTSPQTLRAKRLLAKFVETFSAKGSEPQLTTRKGKELNAERVRELLDDVMTVSLFPEDRFFVIESADEISEASLKLLTPKLENLPPKTVVVFIAESLALAHAISKLCLSSGAMVKLEKLEGEALKKWVVTQLTDAGLKEFPAGLPQLVIDAGNESPDEIAHIIEKFVVFVGDDKPTVDLFRLLFPQIADPGEFELVDACSDPNPARSELLLQQLLRHGKSPFMLLAVISRVFSHYRLIQSLLKKGRPEGQIREILKMPPWVFSKNLAAAKRYKFNNLARHSEAILLADSKLKNRSLGPEAIFSELFSSLRP